MNNPLPYRDPLPVPAAGAPPGLSGASRERHGDELLYESELCRVCRRRDPAGSSILKEFFGPDALQRLRQERRMLERLAELPGVPRLLEAAPLSCALVLEDRGELPLRETLVVGRVGLAELVSFGVLLSALLAALHRAGVVHGNLTPGTILRSASGELLLIDFSLATSFAEEPPRSPGDRELAGELHYLAPEQTGRTAWSVDQRADLYALGALLYELATGRPPFPADDPLQLIHDLLTAIPPAPRFLNPLLPQGLSDLVLRLLEKEPERRYQSAEGVAHDLARLGVGEERFPLCSRDFPLRLSPRSPLVGRERELATLGGAFDEARLGRGYGVLVTGGPGIGKSALVEGLRPAVASRRGFFVAGRFDRHRREPAQDAVQQALRELGSLLLAEPELETIRGAILECAGANAGILAARFPELGLLLDTPPLKLEGDPVQGRDRLVRAGVDLLRAVATPLRPVLLFLDDLQHAAATPVAFIEALLEERIPGLLLIGAYREPELSPAHPLAAMLARRDRERRPLSLRLENLLPGELARLLEEMLRLPAEEAARLAEEVGGRTGGNPRDSLELINALRRDGKLLPAREGWHWEPEAIRRYLGSGGLVDLLALRFDRLPHPSRELLQVISCLGGETPLPLLACASGLPAGELEERLAAALEEGLLEREGGVIRFRHDRVQQAAHRSQNPDGRSALQLALARRLAQHPDYASVAAQQYLPVLQLLEEPAERRSAALLFREGAARARLVENQLAEKFLAAALLLVAPAGGEAEPEDPLFAALLIERHGALYSLGSLEEADRVYRLIERSVREPVRLAEAACVQSCSLINRGRPAEALALALALLQGLDLELPAPAELPGAVEREMAQLYLKLPEQVEAQEVLRPEMSEPRAVAAAKLIKRVIPAAFFCDHDILAWLVIVSCRLWEEHGPSPLLVGPICHIGHVTVQRQDYRTGYLVMRRTLAVAELRGYEAESGQGRFLFSMLGAPWWEPLEEGVRQAQTAREALLREGDLQTACFSFFASLTLLVDCGASVDGIRAEVEAGFAFGARSGNDLMLTTLVTFRQLLRALAGETAFPGSFSDAELEEESHLAALSANPATACTFHICRGIASLIFGDEQSLERHAGAALRLARFTVGGYSSLHLHLLQALSLIWQSGRNPEQEPDLLAQLEHSRLWLAQRGAECPENFLHLSRLVEAELAGSRNDFRAAISHFDAALLSCGSRRWQRALICERAARFHLEHGLRHSAGELLAEARELYRVFGAQGKVRQLDERHPELRVKPTGGQGLPAQRLSGDSVDLLAVLRASQALSSETGLERLRLQVEELLGALTGATSVRLVLWQEERQDWALLSPGGSEGSLAVPLRDAVRENLLPLSALRYAERTREPLLVEDAKTDPRFRHDPYLAKLDHLSLLAVPILSQGAPSAMLLLENRQSRGLFGGERLDAVTLIAGQLAVSLQNALLYEKLEERVRERTRELQEAQSELMSAARQAGMAEIASNVLHNVGNVLNSVNVSAGVVVAALRESRAPGLLQAVKLMQEHRDELPRYLTHDPRGRLLPDYLGQLALALAEEQQGVLSELGRLTRSIDHIKEIVATQQCYARGARWVEPVRVQELVEDALRMDLAAAAGSGITVEREYQELPVLPLDKGRFLQILVNLVRNARQSLEQVPPEGRRLTLRLELPATRRLRVTLSDTGEGIPPEHLERIFNHGFSTREGGHGFGLHSCALAASEMGGSLTATSRGHGQGASFILELPVAAAGEVS